MLIFHFIQKRYLLR